MRWRGRPWCSAARNGRRSWTPRRCAGAPSSWLGVVAVAVSCISNRLASSGSTPGYRVTIRCGSSTSRPPRSGSAVVDGHAGAPGLRGFDTHSGRSVPGELGELVCFAGRGPGEVFHGGRKLVGLSQWRSRQGALFSSCAYLHWDPDPLLDLLAWTSRPGKSSSRPETFGGRPARDPTSGRGPGSCAGRAPGLVCQSRDATADRWRRAERRVAVLGARPSRPCTTPRPPVFFSRSSFLSSLASSLSSGIPTVRSGWSPASAGWGAGGGRRLLLSCRGVHGGCVGGGKWRKVVRNGATGRQRTQARERRGRYSRWQASSGGTSTRSTRRAG